MSSESEAHAALVKKTIRSLGSQAEAAEKDIARYVTFIEQRSTWLQSDEVNFLERKEVERMVAERMILVDALRGRLQMIELLQELLTEEQAKLQE